MPNPKHRHSGLYPACHPKSTAWRVDYDYISKLSDNDKTFLAEFTDQYYGAKFTPRSDSRLPRPTQEQRRASYTDKNTANRDIYTAWYYGFARVDLQPITFNSLVDIEKRDLDATPPYLDSPLYKERLSDFRANLAPGRRYLKPKVTPQYLTTKAALEEITIYE